MNAQQGKERAATMIVMFLGVLSLVSLSVAAGMPTIELSWNQNQEEDLAAYRVYCNGAPVQNVSAPATQWTYAPGKEGQYAFYITAVDVAGNESGKSNTVSLVIDVPPSPPTGCKGEIQP